MGVHKVRENSRPLVSVIIPTYNGERFIRETIDSALAQTISDLEIIVINDGSTDSTPAILESYGSRIKVIHQDNGGVASARNAGIEAASGNWVALLDHDDLWDSTKLQKQLDFVQEHPQYAMIYAKANQSLYENGNSIFKKQIGSFPESPCSIQESLYFGNFIPALTVMVRREVFCQIGSFDVNLQPSDDWDMWLRISRVYPIGFLPEVVAKFRLHDSSFHRCNLPAMARTVPKVLSKNMPYSPQGMPWNKVYITHYCYFASQSVNVGNNRHALAYLVKAISLHQLNKPLLSTILYVMRNTLLNSLQTFKRLF